MKRARRGCLFGFHSPLESLRPWKLLAVRALGVAVWFGPTEQVEARWCTVRYCLWQGCQWQHKEAEQIKTVLSVIHVQSIICFSIIHFKCLHYLMSLPSCHPHLAPLNCRTFLNPWSFPHISQKNKLLCFYIKYLSFFFLSWSFLTSANTDCF